MDIGLTGKNVLVTGGVEGDRLCDRRGICRRGRPLSSSRPGAPMHRPRPPHGLPPRRGGSIQTFSADLSQDSERQRLFEAHGDVDILVNNAGAIPAGGIADVTMDAWREGWELKVFGYIHLCQLYVAAMKARGSGTIVNIIGMGGRAVRPNYICGAAGNAALIGFTNALGAEDSPRQCPRFRDQSLAHID